MEREAEHPAEGSLGEGRAGRLCKRLLHDGDETQKIVEAPAEHDFCFQRFIGMLRAIEFTQLPARPSPRLPSAGCPASLSMPDSCSFLLFPLLFPLGAKKEPAISQLPKSTMYNTILLPLQKIRNLKRFLLHSASDISRLVDAGDIL